MPASKFLLSMFITIHGPSSMGNSVMKTWMEDLCLWHMINDTPWHGSHLLCCTLRGTAKVAPPSTHQSKRDLVTIDHLKALQCHLNLSDTFDIAVFAVACIAFWCCCHLGELLINSKFDPQAHVAHSTKITRGQASNNTKFINFVIPCTKTNMNGASINMSDSTCNCSNITAFEHHLSSNILIPELCPSLPLKH